MANRYREFFYETEEGDKFLKSLKAMIETEHREAEKHPELAVAHTQRACGIRDVIARITVMSTEIKQGQQRATSTTTAP